MSRYEGRARFVWRCEAPDAPVVVASLLTFAAVEDEPPPAYSAERSGVSYSIRTTPVRRRTVAGVLSYEESVPEDEVACVEAAVAAVLSRAASRHEAVEAPARIRAR